MLNRSRTHLLPGALVLVAALAYFAGLARYGYHRAEDGDILQLIYRTAHGQQPYIDFVSGYTPLFFYWHAAPLRLSGDNLMSIRWSLVLVNSLTVWGLYALARTAMPILFAVVAPLAYVAIIPAVPGEFCAFNIPYPAWYTTLLTVVAALAMTRWGRDGRPWATAVAGLAAGLAFSFKPNAGLFALVSAALVLVNLAPTPQGRLGRWLWWSMLAGPVVGLICVFGGRMIDRDARLFLWPIFAVVTLRVVYRRVAARQRERLEPQFVGSCLALGLGFATVTVPWLAYFYSRLGWERFVHEVLFIGSGYEQFFYLAFHAATKWDGGLALGATGLVALTWLVRTGRLPAAVPLTVLGAGAVAGIGYVLVLAPMPEGFQRAVVSRVRDLSFGLWCAGALGRRGPRGASLAHCGQASPADSGGGASADHAPRTGARHVSRPLPAQRFHAPHDFGGCHAGVECVAAAPPRVAVEPPRKPHARGSACSGGRAGRGRRRRTAGADGTPLAGDARLGWHPLCVARVAARIAPFGRRTPAAIGRAPRRGALPRSSHQRDGLRFPLSGSESRLRARRAPIRRASDTFSPGGRDMRPKRKLCRHCTMRRPPMWSFYRRTSASSPPYRDTTL